MNPKLWLQRALALLMLLAAPLGGAPAVRAQGPVTTLATLVDQTAGVNAGALSSNIPNFISGARAAQAADDIVVTTAASNIYWYMQQLTVTGQNLGVPNPDTITVYVYADNGSGTLPGSLYASQSFANPGNGPNYVLPISIAVPGPNRKFWISVQANVTATDGDAWTWQSSSSGAGGNAESAWVELLGSSVANNSCTVALGGGWGARKTVCNIGDQFNMAFLLEGQIVTYTSAVFLPIARR